MHAQNSSLCQLPQACIPLTYAAQIPTTSNPELANVRVSLFNLEPEVGQCMQGALFSEQEACVCVREHKVRALRFCVCLCDDMSELGCVQGISTEK